MKYVRNDGRPWYKQVITGLFLALIISGITTSIMLVACIGLLALYTLGLAIYEYPFILLFIAYFLSIKYLPIVYSWASK